MHAQPCPALCRKTLFWLVWAQITNPRNQLCHKIGGTQFGKKKKGTQFGKRRIKGTLLGTPNLVTKMAFSLGNTTLIYFQNLIFLPLAAK